MKRIFLVIVVLMVLIPQNISAQDHKNFDEWEDLIPYIESLEARIKDLERGSSSSAAFDKQSNPDTNDLNGKFSIGDFATVGDFVVEVTSIESSKDFAGKPVLVVDYKFSNNSERSASFGMSISHKAFQNGIEAVVSYDPKFSENLLTEIRPGASLNIRRAYTLVDITSAVELEVDKLITFSPNPVIFKIPVP